MALSWSASSSSDVARYDAYRAAPGSRTKVSASTQGTSRTFTDTNLTNGNTYSYVMRAVDGAGNESAESNVASARPIASSSGGSRTMTLTAAADTMAKQDSRTSAFGTVTTLRVDGQELSTTESAVKSYLRFEIPALTAGESIDGAVLKSRVSDGSANGPALYRTDAIWSESTLAWNNIPTRTSATSVADFESGGTGSKTIAASGIATGGSVSLELAPETANSLQFELPRSQHDRQPAPARADDRDRFLAKGTSAASM